MSTSDIQRSSTNKDSDQFYVQFFNLDKNVANLLGRQLKRISRPSISFGEISIPRHGVDIASVGRIGFEAIQASFHDDDRSLTNKTLFQQVIKQYKGASLPNSDLLFDIRVKVFAKDGQVVEDFKYLGCFISSIQPSEQIYANAQPNEINVNIRYHDIEFNIDNDVST